MTEAESIPQDARSDRDKVLAYVNDCNEGVSCISVSIGTGIKRSAVESILKSLVEEHAINSAWSTKGGYCMYYPCPEPKKEVITRPLQKDHLEGYERKIEAGEVPTPDPEADRAAPDRFPHEERPKNKCRYCSREMLAAKVRQHEPVCGSNPNRNGGKSHKLRKEEKKRIACPIDGCTSMPLKDRGNVYAHLRTYHKLPLEQVHTYLDKMFPGEPEPSTPVDTMVPDIAPSTPGSERQVSEGVPSDTPAAVMTDCTDDIKEEPKKTGWGLVSDGKHYEMIELPSPVLESRLQPEEPAPIDENVPPLSKGSEVPEEYLKLAEESAEITLKEIEPTPDGWRQYEVSKSVQSCESHGKTGQAREVTSSLSKDVLLARSSPFVPCPPDPLALFAQQHRVRVGREIRKLKKVERKLRRRAAAAEAMAERVKAARKTKERELRRFEKELAEVSS